jgi:hypothetical protein
MSIQLPENDEVSKNSLPELFICSDDYDFISEFDFQTLSEFVKAHQGEWTSLGNIV